MEQILRKIGSGWDVYAYASTTVVNIQYSTDTASSAVSNRLSNTTSVVVATMSLQNRLFFLSDLPAYVSMNVVAAARSSETAVCLVGSLKMDELYVDATVTVLVADEAATNAIDTLCMLNDITIHQAVETVTSNEGGNVPNNHDPSSATSDQQLAAELSDSEQQRDSRSENCVHLNIQSERPEPPVVRVAEQTLCSQADVSSDDNEFTELAEYWDIWSTGFGTNDISVVTDELAGGTSENNRTPEQHLPVKEPTGNADFNTQVEVMNDLSQLGTKFNSTETPSDWNMQQINQQLVAMTETSRVSSAQLSDDNVAEETTTDSVESAYSNLPLNWQPLDGFSASANPNINTQVESAHQRELAAPIAATSAQSIRQRASMFEHIITVLPESTSRPKPHAASNKLADRYSMSAMNKVDAEHVAKQRDQRSSESIEHRKAELRKALVGDEDRVGPELSSVLQQAAPDRLKSMQIGGALKLNTENRPADGAKSRWAPQRNKASSVIRGTCDICVDDDVPLFAHADSTPHRCCLRCCIVYLFERIESGQSEIACPQNDCDQQLKYVEIKQLLSKESVGLMEERSALERAEAVLKRLEDNRKMDALREIPFLLWCSNPNCLSAQEHADKDEDVPFECRLCRHRTCSVHGLPYKPKRSGKCHELVDHETGIFCCSMGQQEYEFSQKVAQYRPTFSDSGQLIWPDGTVQIVIKKCPKCGEGIEKTEGCRHMTCRTCQHEFFWCCLRAYRDREESRLHIQNCD